MGATLVGVTVCMFDALSQQAGKAQKSILARAKGGQGVAPAAAAVEALHFSGWLMSLVFLAAFVAMSQYIVPNLGSMSPFIATRPALCAFLSGGVPAALLAAQGRHYI